MPSKLKNSIGRALRRPIRPAIRARSNFAAGVGRSFTVNLKTSGRA